MLLLLLTLNTFRFLGRRFECDFGQVCYRSSMKSEIYVLDKENEKKTKNEKSRKFCYPDNLMTKNKNSVILTTL